MISAETLNKEKSLFTFICKDFEHLPGSDFWELSTLPELK